MTATAPNPDYPLGNTQAEHERLARQAAYFAPITERVFRGAGVGPGQRVLDLGSGAGDVALLVADIVGPTGEVVGVERNPESIAWARERVEKAGLRNVTFTQSDVGDIPKDRLFDAVVGRFILMFVPDPVGVVHSALGLVKPGGVMVFLEPSWKTILTLSQHLPFWYQALGVIHETILRSGAHPDMGIDLHRVFQAAGAPAPSMHMDTMLGATPEVTCWASELLVSMRPQIQRLGISMEALGDLATLARRHQAEVEASGGVVPRIPLVGAWAKIR